MTRGNRTAAELRLPADVAKSTAVGPSYDVGRCTDPTRPRGRDQPSCSADVPHERPRERWRRCSSPRRSPWCPPASPRRRCPPRSPTRSAWSTAWCEPSRSRATRSGWAAPSPGCGTPTAPPCATCRTWQSSTPTPARRLASVAVPLVTKGSGAASSTTSRSALTACSTSPASSIRSGRSRGSNVAAIDPSDGSVAPFAPGRRSARSVLADVGRRSMSAPRSSCSFELERLAFPRLRPAGGGHRPFSAGAQHPAAGPRHGARRRRRRRRLPVRQHDRGRLQACRRRRRSRSTRTPARCRIWTPGNLPRARALRSDQPASARRPGHRQADGVPRVREAPTSLRRFDLVTGQQVFKTDTSGSRRWSHGWTGCCSSAGTSSGWRSSQRTAVRRERSPEHRLPPCAPVRRDRSRPTAAWSPRPSPGTPGICCKYNGVWAHHPRPRPRPPARGRRVHEGRRHLDRERHRLAARRGQDAGLYARFSGTPTTLEPLTIAFAGDGSGRVLSDPPGADCTTDCEVGFVDGHRRDAHRRPGAGLGLRGLGRGLRRYRHVLGHDEPSPDRHRDVRSRRPDADLRAHHLRLVAQRQRRHLHDDVEGERRRPG